eukprot:gene14575-biopygen15680
MGFPFPYALYRKQQPPGKADLADQFPELSVGPVKTCSFNAALCDALLRGGVPRPRPRRVPLTARDFWDCLHDMAFCLRRAGDFWDFFRARTVGRLLGRGFWEHEGGTEPGALMSWPSKMCGWPFYLQPTHGVSLRSTEPKPGSAGSVTPGHFEMFAREKTRHYKVRH